MWAPTDRCTVANGVRQVTMILTQHVPSHLVIAGQRVLISYDGQPNTRNTGHLYPTFPRGQGRALLSSPNTPVTYAVVAATMSHLSGDQPGASIQGERPPILERVLEINEHIMVTTPPDPERCTSPMDSNQSAELGDTHTPKPRRTGTSDGSLYPSLLEVNDPQVKRATPGSRHQGRTLDLCLVKKIPRNPDRPFATHYLPAKLVPQLLQTGHGELIKGGDFICVTDPADTSGNFHTRRALTEMICGLHLADASTQDPTRLDYTHYSTTGARIYITRNIKSRMTGIDILPAAFTDHNAVVLRLALGEMGARRSHPRWKLDPTMLRDADFLTQLRQQWSRSAVPIHFASRSTFQDRNLSRSTIVALKPKALCAYLAVFT